MNINIYTKLNGVGLEADANILADALKDHNTHIVDWERPSSRKALLGIHLEHIRGERFQQSELNVLIPNPEWFDNRFKKNLARIDVVLCKTWDSMEIFSKLHKDCRYIGFTSLDRNKAVAKRKEFLHLAGLSSHKNTEKVVSLWNQGGMPPLTLQKLNKNYQSKNFTFVGQRIADIEGFLSSYQFHLCPSKAEGFGHYINEALSTGGIVVTTDAPPMNELVKNDYGFLVKAKRSGTHNMGKEYDVEVADLKEKVLECYNMKAEQLNEMSRKSREAFEKRDREFRKNINDFVKCIVP